MSNNTITKHKKTWHKTPTVFQLENTECGAASLSMILAFFGRNVSLEELRADCGVSKDGCNAYNIVEAANKHNLEIEAYKLSLSELMDMEKPCIIHWDFNHFVVYEGIKNNAAYINDPAIGRRKISIEDLSKSFTGIALCGKPMENFEKQKREKNVLKFLARRSQNQKSTLLLLFLLGLILSVPGMLSAGFSKVFVDNIYMTKNMSMFFPFIMAMIASVVFSLYFSVMRSYLVSKFQMKLSLVSGYKFLSHMIHLPTNFYEQRYAGDLSQRVSNNDSANSFLSGRVVGVLLDIITASFYLIFMIVYNIPLTIVGLTGLAITLILTYLSMTLIREKVIKLSQDNGKLSGIVYSGIEISSTLKACGIEENYVNKIVGHYSKMCNMQQEIGRTNQIMSLFPGIVMQITSTLILIIGSVSVINSGMSIGMLFAFTTIFGSFTAPINSLFGLFQQIQSLRADLLRVDDIENYKVDQKFNEAADRSDEVYKKFNGKVEIKNMSFSYGTKSQTVLHDINIDINPGEIVAIVGPSGCGKSSIVKLLTGLYVPQKGEILFDNKPISQHSQSAFTSSVASVSQEIMMFADSIKNNVTFWNNYILDEQFTNALKDACIYDTIAKLPDGFNYHLNQGGNNLSGGQRQRIEIARALVNNPSIIIMDEATNSLDPLVENRIMNNIKKRGCTCIVVAHRLSAIRDADKIICIDKGRIVQVGNHEELIIQEGMYKQLVNNM